MNSPEGIKIHSKWFTRSLLYDSFGAEKKKAIFLRICRSEEPKTVENKPKNVNIRTKLNSKTWQTGTQTSLESRLEINSGFDFFDIQIVKILEALNLYNDPKVFSQTLRTDF